MQLLRTIIKFFSNHDDVIKTHITSHSHEVTPQKLQTQKCPDYF